MEKPLIQQTWLNFKVHFTKGHTLLKQLGSLTIGNTQEFQHANMVHQMVMQAFEDFALKQPPHSDATESTATPSTITDSSTPSLSHEALALQQTKATMTESNQKMIQTMKDMIEAIKNTKSNTKSGPQD